VNIKEFISEQNLAKMTRAELMDLWGFLLADHEQAWLIDSLRARLDKQDGK
jgi:hypothetical protein